MNLSNKANAIYRSLSQDKDQKVDAEIEMQDDKEKNLSSVDVNEEVKPTIN